jgi:hypothetical protein
VKLNEWNKLTGPSPLLYLETKSEKSHFPFVTANQSLFSHQFWLISLHLLINSVTNPPDRHPGLASRTSILMLFFIVNPDSAAALQVSLIFLEKFPLLRRPVLHRKSSFCQKVASFFERMPVHKSRLADACAPDPVGNRPLPTQPAILVVAWPTVRPQGGVVAGIFTFLVTGRFEALPPEHDPELEASTLSESDIGD